MTTPTHPRVARFTWILLALAAFAFGCSFAYRYVIQPWHMQLGMSDAEVAAVYPGDEYVPSPERLSSRGMVIEAPAEQIWPWIIQMDADRAGLYSYDWLEQMMGCDIHNADKIHPEWQNVKPGDLFRLCPGADMPPPYEVIDVRPGQALILGHRPTEADNLPGVPWFETWSFVIESIDADTSRLVVRNRSIVDLWWMKAIEPGEFIMQYGMLTGIKARAERSPVDPSDQMLRRVTYIVVIFIVLLVGLYWRHRKINQNPVFRKVTGF